MARKKSEFISDESTEQIDENRDPAEDEMIPGPDAAPQVPDSEVPESGDSLDTPDEGPPSIDAVAPDATEGPPAGQITEPSPLPLEDAVQYDLLLREVADTSPLLSADDGGPEANEGDALLGDGQAGGTDFSDQVPSYSGEDSVHDGAALQDGRRQERIPQDEYILTIDARDRVPSEQDREETAWHEIRNAYRTYRILTGTLSGVERTPSGRTLAVVIYKGYRVAIPVREMMLRLEEMPYGRVRLDLMTRMERVLSAMLGAEIDFVVKGINANTRSIVASRRDAILRKRRRFYMETDNLGQRIIYEGRVVQARVIAVAEKVIRIEAFGAECAIIARDLSWEWIGDARDRYHVGDRIMVRIKSIDRSSLEDLAITADVRSVSTSTNVDNLRMCQPQCRYMGRVTDVRNGVTYIRLNNGANAIAHSCYDLRTPGKKDDVSFTVTRLDEDRGVAIGIITRIIKQNL